MLDCVIGRGQARGAVCAIQRCEVLIVVVQIVADLMDDGRMQGVEVTEDIREEGHEGAEIGFGDGVA